ncbi:MAG: XapX domain-containing protein [Pseudoxanthomonas sp.]|nr:XapX domain-containing protein [Pseudoxanthomonas sp.]
MILFLAGLATALLIGVGCRLLDLPLPAPPRWQGALLVVAMTAGFLASSQVMAC